MKDVDLENVEVTEEDLMDDDLLAELQDVVGLSLYIHVCNSILCVFVCGHYIMCGVIFIMYSTFLL